MLNKKQLKYKKFFTLAEVLITLTVIGVIASATIPGLLNSTNKQEYVVAAKKTYVVLSQAEQYLIAENGSMPSAISHYGSIIKAFNAKLNVAKYCVGGTLPGECWHNGTTGWEDLYGNDGWNSFNGRDRMQLVDGTLIALESFGIDVNCSMTYAGGTGPVLGTSCGMFIVDVNGFKPPNKAGRDIFRFEVTQNGVFADGSYNNHSALMYCDPTNSNSANNPGCGCGAKVLKEGSMNY